MRELTNIVGIILIVFGVATLGYQHFTHSVPEKAIEKNPVKACLEIPKKSIFPPFFEGSALVAGVILVVIAKMINKK